jgi:hypothetical protein
MTVSRLSSRTSNYVRNVSFKASRDTYRSFTCGVVVIIGACTSVNKPSTHPTTPSSTLTLVVVVTHTDTSRVADLDAIEIVAGARCRPHGFSSRHLVICCESLPLCLRTVLYLICMLKFQRNGRTSKTGNCGVVAICGTFGEQLVVRLPAGGRSPHWQSNRLGADSEPHAY